ELPLYSGMVYMMSILTVMLIVGILFVLRYAHKVKKSPERTLQTNNVPDSEFITDDGTEQSKADLRTKIATAVFVLSFGGMFYGVLAYGWYFTELDRKSTRLNSSHVSISYAVFCLKK